MADGRTSRATTEISEHSQVSGSLMIWRGSSLEPRRCVRQACKATLRDGEMGKEMLQSQCPRKNEEQAKGQKAELSNVV